MSKEEPSLKPQLSLKFTWVSIFFVAALLTSNIMACKIAGFGPILLPASVILFPLCFMLGTVLSEVWGARKAYLVFIIGFAANLLVWLFVNLAVMLQDVPEINTPNIQTNLQLIFQMQFLRIVLASGVAFGVCELINWFVLPFLKRKGWAQRLYVRVVAAVVIGQLFDTALFVVLAYGGRLSNVGQMFLMYYIVKVLIGAVVCTPATYVLVQWARN